MSIQSRFQSAAAAMQSVAEKRAVCEQAQADYAQIDIYKRLSIRPGGRSMAFRTSAYATDRFALISYCYDQVQEYHGKIQALEKTSGLSLSRCDVERLQRETTKIRALGAGIRAFCKPQ